MLNHTDAPAGVYEGSGLARFQIRGASKIEVH